MSLRADEKQRLSSGPMPIDKAMQIARHQGTHEREPRHHALGLEGRRPLQGWTKLPGQVPPAMTPCLRAAPPAPAPAARRAPRPRQPPAGAAPRPRHP